mmetsp:Transcript_77835/g.200399  ORF Transcript_77835/g.200399 Transcript_77835/m.200399 type:complete len:488 (+) Transcript_77835:69-1532(+)
MQGRRCQGGAFGLWVLVCLITVGAAKKKGDDEKKKVLMPGHSFQQPLEYTSLLDAWAVSGASLLERDRLLMHPGVLERAGFAFNKGALLTNNFEIIVHFKVMGDKDADHVPHDQSFAVWYVRENVSAVYNETKVIQAGSWKTGLEQQGMSLSGMLGKFNGFGTVLSMKDAHKKAHPSISFISNDGSRELQFGRDVPQQGAKVLDFRNTLNAAQLRIRVQPTSIEAHLKQSPSLSWNECFHIDATDNPTKPGGFIGLSAWSGTAESGASSDLLAVVQVDVINYDDTSLGEEMKDVSAQIQDAYREMLTDEHRHFVDQKSQGDHLTRLVTMLEEHLDTTKPQDEKLFRALEVLEERVEDFAEDCKVLTAEVRMLLGKSDKRRRQSQGVTSLKKEMFRLRELLQKGGASSMQKLEAVHKLTHDVKSAKASQSGSPELISLLSKQTETLGQTVSSRGTQMTWMMLVLLAAIIGIGLLMWNRMHYYEKKHFI